MQIIEIKNKEQWNDFIGVQKYAQFLQSWEWGKFHEKMGRKVWRLVVVDYTNQRECESESARNKAMIDRIPTAGGDVINDAEILMAAQIIKYDLPFGQSYLYCPRGAIVSQKSKVKSQKLWNIFLKKIKELAKQEKSIFFRFEPTISQKSKAYPEFVKRVKKLALSAPKGQKLWNIFFKKEENLFVDENIIIKHLHKVRYVQPENEWALDMRKTEEEILKEMQQKTRYNIRLAEKKGAQIRMANKGDDFNKFWNLISDTYNRKEIKTHSKEYYRGILETGDVVKLWLAEYQGKAVAANIISYFGDTATYMHGGADYEYRNIMPPYLLQWEAIKDAKSNGFSYYNFGGCSETNSYWQGITRFKKGFGGFEINYSGTYEIGFKRFLYNLYSLLKGLRR
ncbi:MAG: peptidoglycan bridge formation glycyltransferase FemA/FemB family protein [bacterium]